MEYRFGALSPKLSEQLKDVGFKKWQLKQFDGLADAIVLLRVSGLLNDSTARMVEKKLIRRIETIGKKAGLYEIVE